MTDGSDVPRQAAVLMVDDAAPMRQAMVKCVPSAADAPENCAMAPFHGGNFPGARRIARG